MEINRKHFFKIFEVNFNYNIINTVIGQAIKMNSYDAFIFTSTSSASYFTNPVYPFTPKGLLKIFYNAFDYKFVTGIFENTSLKNTPYYLSQLHKFLFNDESKYIVPIEFDSEKEYQEKLHNFWDFLNSRNITPENFIIQRIEKRKNGNGMEPFMEYLTAELFKRKGYIVETQIPLTHNVGTPDFGGYKLREFLDTLYNEGYFTKGFHLIELSMLRFKKNYINSDYSINNCNQAIVGEAKTSTNIMEKQLEKYLNTNLFAKGFEIHPQKVKPSRKHFGLITLDNNHKLKIIDPLNRYIPKEEKKLSKDKYFRWLTNYMKYYLIANLTNDEFNDVYYHYFKENISSTGDVINFVNTITLKELFEFI